MSAQPAVKPKAPAQRLDNRARLIKLVHVGKRELKLDEDFYRNILLTKGGANSAGDMNAAQLQSVVDEFKRLGFKVANKAKPGGKVLTAGRRTGVATVTLAADAQSRKARAMWLTLHAIGQVRDPSEAALLAYAKRQCKVDRLEWVRDTIPLLESLKAWLLRSMPAVVTPYLRQPVETWAGHMSPLWRENWIRAVGNMRFAMERGNVQIVDEWVDLWDLIAQAAGGAQR
jgi:phage gp16-like protein